MSSCQTGTYPYVIRSGDSLWLLAQRYHITVQEIVSANQGIDADNLYIGQIICIPTKCSKTPVKPFVKTISKEGAWQTLSDHIRMLWEQHVYWTRMVILSMALGLPDLELVTNRLLRNPKDFAAALNPFYGEENAAEFSKLITEHLTIAAELVNAAKVNDSDAAADAEKRWYANADQIAVSLGSINPYWSTQEWQKMLYDHLAMTKAEAVDILNKKYEDSISMFENIEREALAMADMMTQGIIKQFSQYYK